jgi:pimeloyl-ACP methyl ester carboxylesterase
MSMKLCIMALVMSASLVSAATAQDRLSVAVGDLTISYGDAGQGEPIVLLHGGGLSSRMWDAFAEAAVAAGYRVLTPDTRNHGGTDNPSGEFSYDLAAADLAGFISVLNLTDPVVMGYSDGGIIIETFLQVHPATASAAVIGGATHRVAADEHYMDGMMAFYGFNARGELPDAALDGIATNMPKFAQRLQSLHATEAEPERWRTLHKLTWPVWTTERTFDLAGFSPVEVPVLVFLGQQDEFFLPEDALALARAFKRGELAIMPGGTHTVFRDRPEVFSAVVLEFLERTAAQ